MTALTDQLLDELDRMLVQPVRSLLGLDLGGVLAARLPERADELIAALTLADDAEAAVAARELLVTIWPHGVVDLAWWRTPLGLVLARAIGAADGEAVTQQVAADMLGVTVGTVSQSVSRGHLDRHPDGGVLRSSVLQRLNNRLGMSLVHARLVEFPAAETRSGPDEWTLAVELIRPGNQQEKPQILLHTRDRDRARVIAEEELKAGDYILLGWL